MKFTHRGRLLAVVALVLTFTSALACADKIPTGPDREPGNRPEILIFEAVSTKLLIGQATIVRWDVSDKSAEIRIDGSSSSIGNGLPDSGQFTFTASSLGTFTYTLTATNRYGSSSRFVTILVTP